MRLRVLLFLFMGIFFARSQEQSSFKGDSYSGVNGVTLDPTHFLTNPNPWDINLIGVDSFFQNNYAYISGKSLLGLPGSTLTLADYNYGPTAATASGVLDFYSRNKYNANASVDVLGPSASFSVPINHGEQQITLGFFTRFRALVSGYRIDGNLDYHNFALAQYQNLQEFAPLKVVAADWSEIGFNGAFRFYQDEYNQWQIGLNLKYNQGYDAGFANSTHTIKVTADSLQAIISNYDVMAGYSSAYDFNGKSYSGQSQGSGFGGDLAITYIQNKDKKVGFENEYAYDTKLNLSILDLGYIRYSGEKHEFVGNTINTNSQTFTNVQSPHDFFQVLSNMVYGNVTQSLVDHSFTIGLPTAFSFSYSKNIKENQYLTAGFVQRLPIYEYSLKRANSAYVNYRVQKGVLGYGASLSLYEYITPQLGGYVRFGPIYFGSDNILPVLFNQKRLHSYDVYFGIKIYPFWGNNSQRRPHRKCDCDKR